MKLHVKAALAGVLAAGMLSVSATAASAATASGDYAVHGMGAQNCAVLAQPAFKSNPTYSVVLASWIMGYVTASNLDTKTVFDRTPIQSPGELAAMVASVCAKQHALKIDSALASVLAFLSPGASTVMSAPVEFKSDKYATIIRMDVAQKIQTGLSQKGLYKGGIDGKNSPELATALRTFQKSEKITETGIPDADTVIHLIIAKKK